MRKILFLLFIITLFPKNASCYAPNTAMHEIDGFAKRQMGGKGWCYLDEIQDILRGDSKYRLSEKVANKEERADIIKARARCIKVSSQSEIINERKKLDQAFDKYASQPKKQYHIVSLMWLDRLLTHYKVHNKHSLGMQYYSDSLARSLVNEINAVIQPGFWGSQKIEKLFAPNTNDDLGRKRVFEATRRAYDLGAYINNLGQVICLDTVTPAQRINLPLAVTATQKFEKTKLLFDVVDSFTLFRNISAQYDAAKIAVVNYANAITRGGGVDGGGNAQEEDLMRTAGGLDRALEAFCNGTRYHTPLADPEHGSVADAYFSQAIIMRDVNYNALPTPQLVNVITSAAYNLHSDNHLEKPGTLGYIEGTKRRIRAQLVAALNNGCTVLVTGLFGCGAFGNKPEDISKLYAEVLEESDFQNKFEAVYFSMYKADEAKQQKFKAPLINRLIELGGQTAPINKG